MIPCPAEPGHDRTVDELSIRYATEDDLSNLAALRWQWVGGQILAAVSRRSGQLKLERVTVPSSPDAVPAYERAGFELSPYVLCRPTPRGADQ